MAEDEVDVSDLSDIEVSAHVHLFKVYMTQNLLLAY